MTRRLNRSVSIALAVLAACSSGTGGDGLDGSGAGDGDITAQVASYEPVVGEKQRFILGLVDSEGNIVGFGRITLDFAYLGTRGDVASEGTITLTGEADYRLVAGQKPAGSTQGPRIMPPSDGVGVYGADVTFDKAGFWGVRARATLDGEPVEATATFEVYPEPINPFPGEPAPRTVNRLPGAAGIEPQGIDSRAEPDGTVPDPELHATTIADAIAAGRPVMVVVSTPVYCVSRFCGPITDTVQRLAETFGDRMDFVHLEVWNDFEGRALNKEAAEWIYQEGADPKEPWVFLVAADGSVAARWDNVATDDELEAAVQGAVSG